MARTPLVLDEFVDRVLSRPLGGLVAHILRPTPFSPNAVTMLAGLAGIVVGQALAFDLPGVAVVGVFLFLVFDCADGMLARLRGTTGFFGRAFDGVGDGLASIGIHIGLCFALAREPGLLRHPIAGVAAALLAAASLLWSSGLLDRYKRRYAGKQDDLVALDREIATSRGFVRWLLNRFRTYARKLDSGSEVIPDRVAYQEAARWPMRIYLVLGPSTHYALFAVAVALDRLDLYVLATIVVGNALVLWANVLQARAEAGLGPSPAPRSVNSNF